MQSLLYKIAPAGMFNRLIRHLLVGGMGTLLYTILVAFFVEITHFHPVVCVVLAFILLMIYTYSLNRVWVYNASKGHGYAVPRFLTVTIIALLLNAGIMYIVVEVLHWWYFWGLVVAAGIVPPTNFLLNYYWAFK